MYTNTQLQNFIARRIRLTLRKALNYAAIFQNRKLQFLVVLVILMGVIFYTYSLDSSFTNRNIQSYTDEEKKFPIAYSIMVSQDADDIYRLFKAIYRPFNYYCFHVDTKSYGRVRKSATRLWRKYDNVILPIKFVPTEFSKFSELQAELLCMKAFLFGDQRLSKSWKNTTTLNWKYFINLSGQDWPLKTNLEIVRILKALNGSNSIEKVLFPKSRMLSKSVPHKIQLWKGAVHIIAKRDFVEFALTNLRAQALLNYLKKIQFPEETFFATLNNDHSFEAPGGFSGNLTRHPTKLPFISRHKIWSGEGNCYGHFQRDICIFGVRDIPAMIDPANPHLFANKFVKGQNDEVLNYMEQWFYKRARTVYQDTSKNPFINLEFYRNLAVTKQHF